MRSQGSSPVQLITGSIHDNEGGFHEHVRYNACNWHTCTSTRITNSLHKIRMSVLGRIQPWVNPTLRTLLRTRDKALSSSRKQEMPICPLVPSLSLCRRHITKYGTSPSFMTSMKLESPTQHYPGWLTICQIALNGWLLVTPTASSLRARCEQTNKHSFDFKRSDIANIR